MASFEQIQTFIEVARATSFIQAARKLNIPRSTVTARINALEDRLNTRLLHRTTRSVSLTDEGQRYFNSCAAAMDSLSRVEDDLTSNRAPVGLIRMSIPLDFPKCILATLTSEFVQTYPDVTFQIHVSDTMVDLVADAFDIALRGRHPGSDSLIARKLKSEPLILLAPGNSGSERLTQEEFDQLSIIDPTGIVRPVYSSTPNAGGIESGNFEMAKAIAKARGMFLIVPQGLARSEIEEGTFHMAEPPVPLPEIPLYYVLPSRDFVPHRVRLFADFHGNPVKGLIRLPRRGPPVQ